MRVTGKSCKRKTARKVGSMEQGCLLCCTVIVLHRRQGPCIHVQRFDAWYRLIPRSSSRTNDWYLLLIAHVRLTCNHNHERSAFSLDLVRGAEGHGSSSSVTQPPLRSPYTPTRRAKKEQVQFGTRTACCCENSCQKYRNRATSEPIFGTWLSSTARWKCVHVSESA